MTILNQAQHFSPSNNNSMELLQLRRDESMCLKEEDAPVQEQPTYHDAVPELRDEECSSISSCDTDEESNTSFSVRFSIQPTVVHEYIHFNDLTDEEREACWMTYDDRMAIVSDVKRIKQQQQLDNTIESRGLEPRRKRFLRNTRMVVLQEQERQRRCAFLNRDYSDYSAYYEPASNDVAISSKYILATQGCATIAHERAKQDYLEVVQMRSMDAMLDGDDEESTVFYDSASLSTDDESSSDTMTEEINSCDDIV